MDGVQAEGYAHCWRYTSAEVAYLRETFAFGGPAGFAMTAGLSWMRNRAARQGAERAAAPQWRSLGCLYVRAMEDRLEVAHSGRWATVWFAGVRSVHTSQAGQQVILTFDGEPPYALCGPDVPRLVAGLLSPAMAAA